MGSLPGWGGKGWASPCGSPYLRWILLSLPSSSPHTQACRLTQESPKDMVPSGTPLPTPYLSVSQCLGYSEREGSWACGWGLVCPYWQEGEGRAPPTPTPTPTVSSLRPLALVGRLGRQSLLVWRQAVCHAWSQMWERSEDIRQDTGILESGVIPCLLAASSCWALGRALFQLYLYC